MNKIFLLLFITLSLVGCESEPPEKTVWDDQLKTIDKAKQIEDTLLNVTQEQHQQIEQHISE